MNTFAGSELVRFVSCRQGHIGPLACYCMYSPFDDLVLDTYRRMRHEPRETPPQSDAIALLKRNAAQCGSTILCNLLSLRICATALRVGLQNAVIPE